MTASAPVEMPQDVEGKGHTLQTRMDRDDRRVEVGRMILAHQSSRTIGKKLGVDHKTVLRDAQVVRRWWQAQAARHYDDFVAEECAKLDEMERTWMARAHTDLCALDRVLRIMERRAKLLGLDQPARADLTVTVNQDELRTRALELVTSHAERRALYDGNGSDDVIDVESEDA